MNLRRHAKLLALLAGAMLVSQAGWAQDVIDLDNPDHRKAREKEKSQAPQPKTSTAGEPKQMIVAIAGSENSPTGKLRLFSRDASGNWKADSDTWYVNFGRRGLAWGLGLHPDQEGKQKREGDWRTPAGVFRVGKVLGNPPNPPEGNKGWPYHHKTDLDTWPENSSNPYYNQLYTVDPANKPDWYEKERFRLHDDAYYYLIVVDHNRERNAIGEAPKTKPKRGSAIFFHTQRQYDNGSPKPSAGCTTMPRERLVEIIKWLEPGSEARYVVLTESDFSTKWKDWDLPSPQTFNQ